MKLSKTSLILALYALVYGTAHAAPNARSGMMSGEGMMGGWVMVACMLFGLLVLIVLVLAIFALVKYLRSDRRPRH